MDKLEDLCVGVHKRHQTYWIKNIHLPGICVIQAGFPNEFMISRCWDQIDLWRRGCLIFSHLEHLCGICGPLGKYLYEIMALKELKALETLKAGVAF